MKVINTDKIKKAIYDAILEINCILSSDVSTCINEGLRVEESDIGRDILEKILENNAIAKSKRIPICQDTGMVVIFAEIGQYVSIEGDSITKVINDAVREAYRDGYFRKSVVSDPIERINTGDNTPAVIYYDIKEGSDIKIQLTAKGFGSENMSALKMLKPSDGIEGVIEFVKDTVYNAGPNACPPMFVGVGIGGTMDKCAQLSKKALLRDMDSANEKLIYSQLESQLMELLNKAGIGPMGLGGTTTVLGVNIETYPTHIAGLPVAVNICCHVNRHKTIVIKGE
ncbi:MAG: fumarate hydratase [Eubacteriaceae bacterium]|nr:fumarate hydratase [Eubacteriaceae bacterium]